MSKFKVKIIVMRALFVCFFLLTTVGCIKQETNDSPAVVEKKITNESHAQENEQQLTYHSIQWPDLMPTSDFDALTNPPDYITEIEDGSIEDRIASTMQRAIEEDEFDDSPYEQALISTNVIASMNGKNIRLPGFVVPVDFNDEQLITSFFLVPFFGACLHMPPPPPNQIIYVEYEQGITLSGLYEPIWVLGTLSTELFEDQIATSAYTMKMHTMEYFDDVQ